MKNTDNQDLILKDLLNKLEPVKAPENLKTRVLNNIHAISPGWRTVHKETPAYKIWIPVLIVVVFCLGWSLAQVQWSGWSFPDLGFLSNSKINWNFSDKVSDLSKNLSTLSLPNGNWITYMGGGIIIGWLFFIIISVLNRFSKKHQALSE